MRYVFLFVLLSLIMLGCDDDKFTPELVVSGYLYPNEEIKDIRLNETCSIDAYYDSTIGLSGARIVLNTNGKSIELKESQLKQGYYGSTEKVIAGAEYSFDISVKDYHATGQTLVPEPIELTTVPADTITMYDPIPLSWTASKSCHGYMLTIVNREEIKVPIDEKFDERSRDQRPDIPTFLLKKEITSINIPVILFWYYGKNVIKLYAIDKNTWDFIRTSDSWETSQPIYHITGALGVLGGMSVDSTMVFIRKI